MNREVWVQFVLTLFGCVHSLDSISCIGAFDACSQMLFLFFTFPSFWASIHLTFTRIAKYLTHTHTHTLCTMYGNACSNYVYRPIQCTFDCVQDGAYQSPHHFVTQWLLHTTKFRFMCIYIHTNRFWHTVVYMVRVYDDRMPIANINGNDSQTNNGHAVPYTDWHLYIEIYGMWSCDIVTRCNLHRDSQTCTDWLNGNMIICLDTLCTLNSLPDFYSFRVF